MKYRFFQFIFVYLFLLNIAFGFDSIRLQWDREIDCQGNLVVNGIYFYVFQMDQNENEILEYWCILNEQNNWIIHSYYGNILYNQDTREIEFIFHDGNAGAIFYNVYKPLICDDIYIEEYRYFLNDFEHFSIKCTYNSFSEVIKIQGNVYGNKAVLTMDNNFFKEFDDGTSIVYFDSNIQINAYGNPNDYFPMVGITEFSPPEPGCPCYTHCDCMIFGGNPDMC